MKAALLLNLYPARFRRAFGDEIAETYREATADAGRGERLRETAGIVAHAVRMRLGIGSAHPGGQLLAVAAPFALAATGAYASFNLSGNAADWYVMRNAGTPAGAGELLTAANGCSLLTLIGAVVALSGRRAAGMAGVLAGTLGSTAAFLWPAWGMPPATWWRLAGFLLAPIAVAALPLACPPDLRPAPRVRSAAAVLALVAWAVLAAAAMAVFDPLGIGLMVPWRLGVPVALALLLAGRTAFAAVRTVPQLACCAAPFLATMYFSGWVQDEKFVALLVVLAITAAVLRLRRTSPEGPRR